jgi:hypothetical protein
MPIDQAKFWLAEADRIAAKHPRDPELLMGAAIVLFQPCQDFASKQFPPREHEVGDEPYSHDRYFAKLQGARTEFESAVRASRAELASRACKLAPTNVNLQRLSAILASQAANQTKNPRDDAELNATLADGAVTDPDNALYDYLAAFHARERSTRYVSGSGGFFEPTDQALYARCFELIEKGKQKPFLSEGADEMVLLAKFLERSRTTQTTRSRILGDSRLEHFRLGFDRFLFQSQYQLVREAELAGHAREAMARTQEWEHFAKQSERGDVGSKITRPQMIFRQIASSNRRWFAREHADVFPAEERLRLREEERRELITAAVYGEAAQQWSEPGRAKLLDDLMTQRSLAAAASLALGIACQYCLLLALVAVASWALAYIVISRQPVVSDRAAWFAFPLAAALSLILFGLCPAGVIPDSWQKWITTMTLFALAPLGLGHIAWKSYRAKRLRFSLVDVFALMTLICVTFGVFSLFGNPESTWRMPLQLYVPSRSTIPGLSAAWAAQLKKFPIWWQVTLHALAYYAQHLTLAIWAFLLAAFCFRRSRMESTSHSDVLSWLRRFARGYIHLLAKSSKNLLVASSLLYLALSPSIIQLVEDDYQWRMSYVRRPQWHLDGALATVEAIKADPVRMAEITARVEKFMARDDARPN